MRAWALRRFAEVDKQESEFTVGAGGEDSVDAFDQRCVREASVNEGVVKLRYRNLTVTV